MKYLNKENIFVINGLLMAVILIAIIISVFKSFIIVESRIKTPQIAGQNVPEENFIIDFSKRYNIISKSTETTYKNVKILGYTGQKVQIKKDLFSSNYGYFNRWLVIELLDKRRVYLPEFSIGILEETENQ